MDIVYSQKGGDWINRFLNIRKILFQDQVTNLLGHLEATVSTTGDIRDITRTIKKTIIAGGFLDFQEAPKKF